jgi:hypothetical protein
LNNGVTIMSPLDAITGNEMRSQAILMIVREAMDEGQCDLEHAAAKAERFGSSFTPMQADEFAAAVEILKPVEFEAEPELPAKGSSAPELTDNAVSVGSEPIMTRDEAHAHLKSLQDALYTAQSDRRKVNAEAVAARAAMATAIGEWNGQGGGYSQEMLVRDHIAANQQHKKDVKDGKVAPRQRRHVADSYFDRAGAWGRGDANSFVRRSHNPGQPWRGGNRGAFPASMVNAPVKTKGEA